MSQVSVHGAVAALAAALGVVVSGCNQCGVPSGGTTGAGSGPSATAGGTTTTGTACVSPAIEAPGECKLARTTVKSPSFAPDGRTVLAAVVRERAGGTSVESAEVWDGKKGVFQRALVKDLEPHGALEIAWSPDGGRVAVAGVGDSHFGFRIFEAAGWKALHEEDNRFAFPCALAVDPAGERVAMTTLIGQAAIHDLKSGKRTATLATTGLRAAGHVCSALEWSGDGKAIQVEGLRLASGLRPVPYKPSRVTTAAPQAGAKPVRDEDLVETRLAPKGDVAAFLDRKGNVRLFGKHGTVPLRVLPAGKDVPVPADPSAPPVRSLSWRPDAAAIATWDHTGKIRVWDVAKGELLREVRAGAKAFEVPADPEVESARLVWAADGRSFAFWDGERPELWDAGDGTQKLKNEAAPKPDYPTLARMSFRPDGTSLAAGRALWDTKSGALIRKLPSEPGQWLDSGRFLTLAAGDEGGGGVRILRVSDGAVLVLDRLGDEASPVLLPHTGDGVFQGPRELAGCAAAPGENPAPEPRDSLLADFWAGKSVARTCP